MKSDRHNLKQIKDSYNFLREDALNYENFKESDQYQSSFSEKDVKLLKKIAKNCSFDEYKEVLTNCELPAIKLNNKEMEVLQAGLGHFSRLSLAIIDYKSAFFEGSAPPVMGGTGFSD